MKKIIILTLLIFLSGCFGKVEIDELSIVSAIGVDKSEEGFKITTQVIRSKTISGFQQGVNSANIMIYSKEAESVNEALRKMDVFHRNKVFLGHFQLLVFGEDFAKEGCQEAIEFFFESPQTRQRFFIAVVKEGTAEDLLKIQTPMLDTPAGEINSTIENNAQYYGTSIITYADEAYSAPASDEFEIGITGLKILGDPDEGAKNEALESSDIKTKIAVCGIALFREDKLVGWFNAEESIGYNRILGRLKSTVHTTRFEDGSITSIETISGKLKKKVEIVDNIPHITYNYTVMGVVPSVSTHRLITKEEVVFLQNDSQKTIKETMEKAYQKTMELNVDAFHFGKLINDHYPKYWKLIKDDFESMLSKIKVTINVEVIIVNQSN